MIFGRSCSLLARKAVASNLRFKTLRLPAEYQSHGGCDADRRTPRRRGELALGDPCPRRARRPPPHPRRLRRRRPPAALLGAELKGSIGEGPNHSNHSNSFKIGSFPRKFKNFRKFQHFLNYRRNSDKISSKSEQKSVKRIQK